MTAPPDVLCTTPRCRNLARREALTCPVHHRPDRNLGARGTAMVAQALVRTSRRRRTT